MAFRIDAANVPSGLTTDDFVLRPLVVADAELDYAAVMESRELLRRWEQSTWPADDFTVAGNRADLARHERLHVAGEAFTYTVMDQAEVECLGCVYIFPADARFLAASKVTPVADDRWEEVDAAVYHWVRTSRLGTPVERDLLDALRAWLADAWPLERHVFVTSEPFGQQVALLEDTDLELRFVIEEPDKPGRFLAYE